MTTLIPATDHTTLWALIALGTALATLFARPLAKVNGPEEIGGYLLALFLFTMGLPADLVGVLTKAPLFFLFCGIIAVVNLAFTLAVGKLCKLQLEELLLAVNANLGGAPQRGGDGHQRGLAASGAAGHSRGHLGLRDRDADWRAGRGVLQAVSGVVELVALRPVGPRSAAPALASSGGPLNAGRVVAARPLPPRRPEGRRAQAPA